MKKISLIVILSFISSLVFAFTPIIDGVKDAGWGDIPNDTTFTTKEPIEFNLEDGCYVTDDDSYIYFGIPTDNDPWADGKSIHFHVAIDIRNTPTGATYDQWGSSITYSQTYLPDYDIISQWNTDDQTPGWTGFETWNGSSWGQTELAPSNIAGGGNSFTEIAVPRNWLDNIAKDDTINISVWLRPTWDKPNACSCLPEDDTFPSDWGDPPAGTFTAAFSYIIQTESADTTAPTVVSAQQVNQYEVDITFSEPIDTTTATISGYYTIDHEVTVSNVAMLTSSKYRLTTSGFTGGINYTVTVSSDVTDEAGNGVDPSNNSASFIAALYAPITFVIVDTANARLTNCFLKGSWDKETGVYDVTWDGGATEQMYDDGTHGDLYADDHRWSRLDYLVPDSTETWEWGAEDQNHNWLIEGPNLQFTVINDSAQTLEYILPFVNETSQDVTVTFQVYMGGLDSLWYNNGVSVQGSVVPLDWNAGSNLMVDPDEDLVYTGDILFPAGSLPEIEYKFTRCDNDSIWSWEDAIGNRSFIIDDSDSTQILDMNYWDDIVPVPQNITISVVGQDVHISWDAVFGATDYEVLRSSDPYTGFTHLANTGGATSYQDSGAGGKYRAEKYFYQIKAIRN